MSHEGAGPQHAGTIHIGSERYGISSVFVQELFAGWHDWSYAW